MPIDFKRPRYFKEIRFSSTLIWSAIAQIISKIIKGNLPLNLNKAVEEDIISLK